MSTKNTKTKKCVVVENLKFSSFDDVFGKVSKKADFKRVYSEELARLRLAGQIRELRHGKHLTQKIVAEKTGMPQSVIARVESGEQSISVDTLGRIAYALGKEVHLV